MSTYWKEAESSQLRALAYSGKTDPQIAEIMGRSISSIKHRRKRMGIPSAGKENGKGRAWPKDEDELLIEMCKKNLSDSTIARSLNRTVSGIRNRIMRIGARGNYATPRYMVEDKRPENQKACSHELLLLCRHFPVYAKAYYKARIQETKLPPELPEWENKNGFG